METQSKFEISDTNSSVILMSLVPVLIRQEIPTAAAVVARGRFMVSIFRDKWQLTRWHTNADNKQ
jgi:hypothetical protein